VSQPEATAASPGASPPRPGGGRGDEIVTRPPDKIEAWSRVVLTHALWVGVGASALALQFTRVFRGLYLSEAMDLAQLGRHLAMGQGYVSSFLRPVVVALYQRVPAPEVVHPPLYPFLLGVVFGVLPETDAVVAGVSAFFFMATVALMYLLGSRMFGRTAGVLGAVLFAVSLSALGYAVSGLQVTLWAFLFTLVVYLLYINPGSLRRSLAAGAVLGLCWLTEHMTIALIVPALLAAYYMQPRRRLAHLAWFALGLVVVMAPWWVRNYRVTGDPFFTLDNYQLVMFTGSHPGHELFRTTDTSALNLPSLVADSLRSMARKEILGLASVYQVIPTLIGLYVVAFLVVAMFRRLEVPRANLARRLVFVALAFMVVIGALYNATTDNFFVLMPLLITLCAGYFFFVVREWISSRGGQAAAALLFVALSAYPAVVSWAFPQPKTVSSQANLDYLERVLPADAVVVSDAPWAVAWYARRAAVWLPLRPEDFDAVQQSIGVDAIFFSTLLQTYPQSEGALMWQAMYARRAAPPGFTVTATLPPGEILMRRTAPAPGPGASPGNERPGRRGASQSGSRPEGTPKSP